jgi:hypothetical protein
MQPGQEGLDRRPSGVASRIDGEVRLVLDRLVRPEHGLQPAMVVLPSATPSPCVAASSDICARSKRTLKCSGVCLSLKALNQSAHCSTLTLLRRARLAQEVEDRWRLCAVTRNRTSMLLIATWNQTVAMRIRLVGPASPKGMPAMATMVWPA